MLAERVLTFARIGQAANQVIVDFAETKVDDTEVLSSLKKLLEGEIGTLDSLMNVTVDDANIFRGRAKQRISLGKEQEYAFVASPKRIAYKMVNSADMAEFAETEDGWQAILDYATTKGTKKLNCKPGNIQCGGRCQSGKLNCYKNPSPDQAQTLTDLATKTKSKTKAKTPKKSKAAKPAESAPEAEQLQQPKPAQQPQTDGERTPGENFKKARKFNPNAIEDLTPEQFGEFLEKKQQIKDAEDPNAPYNQTFEQFKASQGISGTKNNYKSALSSAISAGIPVSDERIAEAGLKLTKQKQAQLEANRQELENLKADIQTIQKAIDYPLTNDDETKGFKTSMDLDSAMDYVKDSYFSGLSFYHGNRTSVVDSIENEGADPEKNTRGVFGKGVYFAASKEEAQGYAITSGAEETGVISSAVKMKNPFVVGAGDYQSMLAQFPGEIDAEGINNYLRAKGHDGIYVKDYGYIATFDPRQVVTHSKEVFDAETTKRIQNEYLASGTTMDKLRQNVQNSDTGKALSDAPETLKAKSN